MKCGFGRSNITPTEPAELAGYGPDLHRVFDGVHDELWVRALALDDGSGTYVLIELDVTEMGSELIDTAIGLIRTRLSTDVVPHVILAPIHTHNAPAVLVSNAWGEFAERYAQFVASQITQAASNAVNDLTDCTVEYGESRVPEIGFNRAHGNQPWDDRLQVIRFNRANAKSVVLFSTAVHPVTIDQRGPVGKSISADWPGVTMTEVERATGAHAMFVMGTSGDVDPVVAWHMFGFEGARLTGALVAERILATMHTLEPVEGTFHTGTIPLSLPLQWPMTQAEAAAFVETEIERHSGADTRDTWNAFYHRWKQQMAEWSKPTIECEANFISIGTSLAIVSLPGEVFSSVGELIRSESPFRHVVFNTIIGESIGYIPDQEDFTDRGYAAYLSPCIIGYPLYRQDVGSALRQGLSSYWTGRFQN